MTRRLKGLEEQDRLPRQVKDAREGSGAPARDGLRSEWNSPRSSPACGPLPLPISRPCPERRPSSRARSGWRQDLSPASPPGSDCQTQLLVPPSQSPPRKSLNAARLQSFRENLRVRFGRGDFYLHRVPGSAATAPSPGRAHDPHRGRGGREKPAGHMGGDGSPRRGRRSRTPFGSRNDSSTDEFPIGPDEACRAAGSICQ